MRLLCWLRGPLWQFFNGSVEAGGKPLYYCCGDAASVPKLLGQGDLAASRQR